MNEKKSRAKGTPNGPAGKTKLINRRAKPLKREKGNLHKDINEGIRHFWQKRGRALPGPSHWG
jgi:hypothetical protein